MYSRVRNYGMSDPYDSAVERRPFKTEDNDTSVWNRLDSVENEPDLRFKLLIKQNENVDVENPPSKKMKLSDRFSLISTSGSFDSGSLDIRFQVSNNGHAEQHPSAESQYYIDNMEVSENMPSSQVPPWKNRSGNYPSYSSLGARFGDVASNRGNRYFGRPAISGSQTLPLHDNSADITASVYQSLTNSPYESQLSSFNPPLPSSPNFSRGSGFTPTVRFQDSSISSDVPDHPRSYNMSSQYGASNHPGTDKFFSYSGFYRRVPPNEVVIPKLSGSSNYLFRKQMDQRGNRSGFKPIQRNTNVIPIQQKSNLIANQRQTVGQIISTKKPLQTGNLSARLAPKPAKVVAKVIPKPAIISLVKTSKKPPQTVKTVVTGNPTPSFIKRSFRAVLMITGAIPIFKKDAALIKNRLTADIAKTKLSDGDALEITSLELSYGRLAVECGNSSTFNWILNWTTEHRGETVFASNPILAGDPLKIGIQVSKKLHDEGINIILKEINRANSGLFSEHWRVVTKIENSEGVLIHFAVQPVILDRIRRWDWKLKFRNDSVKVIDYRTKVQKTFYAKCRFLHLQ